MRVSMSIIWKFTNLMYLQTKCNQYGVMERRYSNNLVRDKSARRQQAQLNHLV